MIITEVHLQGKKYLQADCQYLDASNALAFKKLMHTHIVDTTPVVIDLQTINFMDSTGLGALVSCLRKVDEVKGSLVLCGMQPAVKTLFELVRLYKVFDIVPTREDAAQASN